jgi:hypothetical protein
MMQAANGCDSNQEDALRMAGDGRQINAGLS